MKANISKIKYKYLYSLWKVQIKFLKTNKHEETVKSRASLKPVTIFSILANTFS